MNSEVFGLARKEGSWERLIRECRNTERLPNALERTENTCSRKNYYLWYKVKSVLSTSKSFAFPAISLREEKQHCLHIIIPGLLLPTTAAVKTKGYGFSTGASASCRTHHGKVRLPATAGGLFTVRSCQALWEPRNRATVLSLWRQIREALFCLISWQSKFWARGKVVCVSSLF